MLDVSFHVTQYQNIIAELKGEIGRLKDKINNEEVRGIAFEEQENILVRGVTK